MVSSIMASDHQSKEALFFLERKIESFKDKCPKLAIVSKKCVGLPPPVVGRPNVCSLIRCSVRPFTELTFVPWPGITHCILDRTKNCLSTIEFRKLVTWSNLVVKPGSFSLKFSRKPSLVLLYWYLKNSALKSAKKKFALQSLVFTQHCILHFTSPNSLASSLHSFYGILLLITISVSDNSL